MWICLILYAIGAIVTSIIVSCNDMSEKDKPVVILASVLWPVTWGIYLMLAIERGFKKFWKFCLQNKFVHR